MYPYVYTGKITAKVCLELHHIEQHIVANDWFVHGYQQIHHMSEPNSGIDLLLIYDTSTLNHCRMDSLTRVAKRSGAFSAVHFNTHFTIHLLTNSELLMELLMACVQSKGVCERKNERKRKSERGR